jgi:hypothetical protein
MMSPTVALLFLFTLADFSSFTYCKQNSRGPYESQCVQLDSQAKGEVTFKRRDADTTTVQIELSPAARDRFLATLSATNYLEASDTYESRRKVADLGRKRLTLEMPSGKREASYNYSEQKPVMDLTVFFDALINQEMIGVDMDNAMQFERLSVPKRLDQIANELKSNRIADPDRLIPMLEKIEGDQRLVNYARAQATRLKQQIQTRK